MKFKQTINVKKFISILLCTIFISSILPSNLLNCTVFATNYREYTYNYEDIKVPAEAEEGYEFTKIVNDTNEKDPKELKINVDYDFKQSDDNPLKWEFTIKTAYLATLEKGKTHSLRIKYTIDKDKDEEVESDPIKINIITPNYRPEIIEPKNIHEGNKNECKLYRNNIKDYGKKTISVKGISNKLTKIERPIDEKTSIEMGENTTSEDGKCEIELNTDELQNLEDGKEYPLSIYQELDSQTKSEPLNVTLCICNNLPTITAVTYNDKKDVTNKKIVEKTGSTILTVKAEGVITKKPLTTPYLVVDADEEGNSPFEKDEDSLKANGWAICSETCQISTSKNNPKARRFVYFKAKDDETGAIGLAKVIISFYKSM